MYIFEKLSTHYKILLLIGTFFLLPSLCVLYSYIFSPEILSRHRRIKLHHAYPFYLNFYFSINFSLSGICLYMAEWYFSDIWSRNRFVIQILIDLITTPNPIYFFNIIFEFPTLKTIGVENFANIPIVIQDILSNK